jgi:hypothetical protein
MKLRLWRLWLPMLLLGLPACGPAARPARFSRISEGGFSPEASLLERGYALKNASNHGVSNPATLVRWRSWEGIATVPGPTNGCDVVASTIRDALNKCLGGVCRDELTSAEANSLGKSGSLSYLQDGMQGEVHVWLFGAPTEAVVRYAVYLREQRADLSPGSSPVPRWRVWMRHLGGTP